jgi:hypothetical protein
MQPSGVQFGLSRGLLQLRGEEALLSDPLLEKISVEAQAHLRLGRTPIRGNFLVDITVRAAQDALSNQDPGSREEMVPFFAHLNRTMYYTLCRVAERAGLGHKEPQRFLTNPDFWAEFCTKALEANIKPGKGVGKIQKALFKLCHQMVKEWYAKNDADNARHTDLVALFIFNFWNSTGLLPMTQAFVIYNSEP